MNKRLGIMIATFLIVGACITGIVAYKYYGSKNTIKEEPVKEIQIVTKESQKQNEQKAEDLKTTTSSDKTKQSSPFKKEITDKITNNIAPTNTFNITYYVGNWKDEKIKGDMSQTGGTGLTIYTSNDGVKGVLGSITPNATHVANVNFEGKLEGNILKTTFSEDGWGHSGTIEMKFIDGKIVAKIETTASKDKDSLYGITNGEITFTINDELPPCHKALQSEEVSNK